jgi:hypothetical protein
MLECSMANVFSPFGFSPEGTVGGFTPNYRLSKRLIASTNTTAIFKGDAVVPVTSTATGYIAQATASTVALAGVFWGCTYVSVSQGRRVWLPYWPGSDANADVTAYVIDDPQAQFLVQATSGPITLANLNQNVQITVGTGSTLTGLSGMSVTTPTTTSTLPFMVTGFIQDPTGANGTDITTAFNYVLVTFNNEIFRAGITSIS